MICQYIETKKTKMEEFGGLADLCHAQRGWCTDRPEHVTHARRSRPRSTRSLRETRPCAARSPGFTRTSYTRCRGPARCTRCGANPRLPRVTVPVTWPSAPSNASWATWACTASAAPSRPERRVRLQKTSARPTWSDATSRPSPRVGCRSPTFPRKREAPLLRAHLLRMGLRRLRPPTCTPGGSSAGSPPASVHQPGSGGRPEQWLSGSAGARVLT